MMKAVKFQLFFSPGNEDSFKATNGDGAADDDKLSFDLVLSFPLFFKFEG